MEEELFNELVTSVRKGGAILRGEHTPSRQFVMDGPDIKHMIIIGNRLEVVPVRDIKEARGFLRGISSDLERDEEDRV
jgi:hypothetical protein